MDAFVLAIHFQMPLFFIKPVQQKQGYLMKLLMRSLHIVALQKGWHRHKQDREGNPWINLRNLLAHNQPLVFFSEHEGGRLKVTKGAAKIAFHTEEVFDFGLNIEIIPVTLDYGKQGDAVILLGQSIPVSAFERDYKKYPARTIKYTTQYLEAELSHDNREAHSEFARQLGRFHQILERKSPEDARPELLQQVTNPVNHVLGNHPPQALQERLVFFFKLLRQYQLGDWSPAKPRWYDYLLALAGAPIFALGHGINWLRFQVSRLLVHLLLPRLRHNDSTRMIVGLILFPLIWLLLAGGVYLVWKQAVFALLVLLMLPQLAQFTFFYWQKCSSLTAYLRYRYFLRFHAGQARKIEQTYAEVLYLLRKSVPSKAISA